MAKQAVSRTRSSTPSKKRQPAAVDPAARALLTPAEMPSREAIAQRAFELYLSRGEASGDEVSDWLRAETELSSAHV